MQLIPSMQSAITIEINNTCPVKLLDPQLNTKISIHFKLDCTYFVLSIQGI